MANANDAFFVSLFIHFVDKKCSSYGDDDKAPKSTYPTIRYCNIINKWDGICPFDERDGVGIP
ncbi:hypothetical protein GCM10023331_18890 [Algivirga pacifica]|uniref:Uncharacterized protein n=1 Tax=Algivirga pacifica TaxID=1162670 RepID=A0ABP9DBB2_9BACT